MFSGRTMLCTVT